VAPKPDRVDVVRIMRQIRDETRARQAEVARRIEHAHKQLEAQFPKIFGDQLRKQVQAISQLFKQYRERMDDYIAEQEPNYATIQHTLAEINRLLSDPTPPPGVFDRWWNPRFWIKRLIEPLRRFVLRRQYEVNALMRDTLFYLVNHSAHIETERMALHLNVQLLQTIETLLEQLEMSIRYFHEWPRASLLEIAGYIDDLYERLSERQAKAVAELQEEVQRWRAQLVGEWGTRLADLSRQMPGVAPSKAASLAGFDYLQFADALRGDAEHVRHQQMHYVPFLRGQENVLDAGCGRGELLELLRDNGIPAYGVDADERMVRHCRQKGLDARCEDITSHLTGLPDQSLGAVVALQLVEHLDFADLFQLLQMAYKKTRPEGVIILETVNPTCLTTFSGAFYADPTHLRPLHPEALRRMLEIVGYAEVKIEFLNPVEEAHQLKPLDPGPFNDPGLRRFVETMNQNIRRINSVLYNFADYAVIGRKAH